MEENRKFFKDTINYKFYTKKIETVLSIAILIFFVISFSGGNVVSAAFFLTGGLILLYYFLVFRKKPYYVVLEGYKITVHDGIMLNPVVVNTESIIKVNRNEKAISIDFKENDTSKSIDIKALLLTSEDFDELYKRLS